MKRTTLFLDEGMERDLKALAARTGEPTSALVREAIAGYLARRKPRSPKLSFLASGRSGRRDVSEIHEELLWQDLAPHGAAPAARKAGRPAAARPAGRTTARPAGVRSKVPKPASARGTVAKHTRTRRTVRSAR
jgi:predicted transcriptional regulator